MKKLASSFEDINSNSNGDVKRLSRTELHRRRHFNTKEREVLFIFAGGQCQICKNVLTNDWQPDHIIPHSKGGETDVSNGQALCKSCNLKKGSS